MDNHWIINEDDFDQFNRMIKSALQDGFEIVSSSSHWDFERNKTIYHALAIDKKAEIEEEHLDFEEIEVVHFIGKKTIQHETRIELSPIDYVLKFAIKGDLKNFCTAGDHNEIRTEIDEDDQPKNSLGRVWNDGMGFLTLAAFADDDTLLINDFLLTADELNNLTNQLELENIKFKLLHFGKDEFNRHTLLSFNDYLNRMKRIQKERNEINFFQWLFK